MSFTKLHNKLIRSTVWNKPNHIRITWITMLAMADRDGLVLSSLPGLATLARLPVEEVEDAIEDLKKPDKYSQSKIAEGRRIRDVEGGWELITYEIHRRLFSAEERREKDAARKRRARSGVSAPVRKSPQSPHIAEADTDTKADTEDPPKPPQGQRRRNSTSIPDDWKPNDKHGELANKHGVGIDLESAQFVAHASAKDRKQVNWDSAFTQWILSASGRQKPNGTKPKQSSAEAGKAKANRKALEAEAEQRRMANRKADRAANA